MSISDISRAGIPVSTFTQSVPSTTWTINHQRGKFLLFDIKVIDNGVSTVMYPQDVEYSEDLNTITITFSKPFAGVVALVDYDTGS